MRLCRLPATRSCGMFEPQARTKGLRFRLRAARRTAGRGARRREAPAPDPDQPAGQRGEVHRAAAASACACATRARWRGSRSRTPARACAGRDLDAVFEPFERGTAASATAAAGRHRPGPDHRRMLTDLMGGEMTRAEHAGRRAAVFRVRLFLPSCIRRARPRELPARPRASATRAAAAHAGGGQRGGRPRTARAAAGAAGLPAGTGRLGRGGARGAGRASSRT